MERTTRHVSLTEAGQLLVEPALRRDITLAWREGRRHPPAARAFLELARDTSDENGPAEPPAAM